MITVWVGESCGPCIALTSALTRAGVPFTEKRATDAPEAVLRAWRAKGWSTQADAISSRAGTTLRAWRFGYLIVLPRTSKRTPGEIPAPPFSASTLALPGHT